MVLARTSARGRVLRRDRPVVRSSLGARLLLARTARATRGRTSAGAVLHCEPGQGKSRAAALLQAATSAGVTSAQTRRGRGATAPATSRLPTNGPLDRT